ncbi:MAG: phage tail tape-measure protein [Mesorhizobium sp.]
MADIASLGLEVRSDQVKKGAADLDRLTAAATRAEAAAMGVATGSRQAASGSASVSSSSAQAAVALDREAAAAKRAAQSLNKHTKIANDNVRRMGGSMSGLAAQFQDIGVTAAAGMSPAIIGLQQGAQIAGQMEMAMASGASAVGVLGTAFKSLFSPLTFVSIILTTLAAAGLQMVDWSHLAASALNGLADVLVTIAPYAAGAAAGLALLYAPAILGGIISTATSIGAVAGAVKGLAVAIYAVVGLPALLVAGFVAMVAAANIFRDELTNILGFDIVGAAKTAVNAIIGFFVGAFKAVVAAGGSLPAAFGDLAYQIADKFQAGISAMIRSTIASINGLIATINGKLNAVGVNIPSLGGGKFGLNNDGTQYHIKNPYAGAASSAMGAAQSAFNSAQGVDYVGMGVEAVGSAASAASGKLKELAGWMTTVDEKGKKGGKGAGGKTEADKYQDIVDGANRRIASLQAEQAALGLTETEALRLKYTQDLLNQAQQKGITLTAAQRAELAGLANTMATTEVATKKAKEAFEFAKDATKGFLSDLRQGLANGEGFWKSFGNAALNVLNKIIDKIETQLVDALFSASSAGSGGGGGGGIFGTILRGIGSLFGFASGGYTGRGAASSVAGVVHGGEYVFSKKATDRIGIGALDQLHQRAKGYAGGGYVTPAPRITPSANQNGQNVHVSVGVSVDKNGNLQAYVKDVAQQEGGKAAQVGISRYDKTLPGRISDVMERHG